MELEGNPNGLIGGLALMTRGQLKQLASAPLPRIELGEKIVRVNLYRVEQVFEDSAFTGVSAEDRTRNSPPSADSPAEVKSVCP